MLFVKFIDYFLLSVNGEQCEEERELFSGYYENIKFPCEEKRGISFLDMFVMRIDHGYTVWESTSRT